jgi:hypothetical protein
MVGHLSYLLLVISMLMRSLTTLRILVIASALAAITYDTVWLKDPVGVFWETLLVTVNVIQISWQWYVERRVRFSPEEAVFVDNRLRDLSRKDARRLLNMGLWVDGEAGTTLTTEGEPVRHLVYLTSGQVDIFCAGVKVGACVAGNFVGEMSVLNQSTASATAVVTQPSRYWLIRSEKLSKLRQDHPVIAAAIETGIARDLRKKIISANTARADVA